LKRPTIESVFLCAKVFEFLVRLILALSVSPDCEQKSFNAERQNAPKETAILSGGWRDTGDPAFPQSASTAYCHH